MKPLRWLAVLSLLAVFIAPPTQRTAFEQARLVLGLNPPQAYLMPTSTLRPNPAWLERRRNEDYQRTSSKSYDIGVHMAAEAGSIPFSITEYNKAMVDGLRRVLAEYPDEPAVYAQLLKYGAGSLGEVGDEYKAAKPEYQPLRDAIDPKPAQPLPRVTYTEFLSWAAAGESFEPDNAFFPAARSVCLFRMSRKQEGLAALQRAVSRTRWDDHSSIFLKGQGDLQRETYGRTDPLVFTSFDITPVYATMREMTRSAVEEAQALERAGKAEAGLSIRRDLWRMARVWRTQSRDVIGAMSATAVGSMALGHLGEEPKIDKKWPDERKRQVRRDAALAFLRRTGHGADADWLRADLAKSDAMHDIISQGLDRVDIVGIMTKAMGSWAASAALLNAALWLALLAVLTKWVNRDKAAKRRRTLAAAVIVLSLFAWQGHTLLGFLASSGIDGSNLFLFGWGSAAIAALAVPLVLATIFDFTALIRRKPFFATSSKWLRASLAPAACVLALLFVGVSLLGVKPQRAFREYSAAQVTGEGPYYAKLVGKLWPQ